MIGQTIAQYHITDHLGTGGMGEVYLAVDSKLDRKVALKFLPPSMSAAPDAKARFLQEARAASALNHPNVCTIYDIQEHDGRMFIVMEYVEGKTLRDHTAPFSIKQVVEIGIQVADGLAAAHEKGIVHRDIKTENIMIRKDGIVQIMDFGLAKLRGASRLTKEGSTVGTVGYMSPEQVQGLDADHRTDLFSLGVVLYELIAGQLPFKGVHETAIMYEIVNVDAQPLSAIRPDIDPELDRIILDCLQKDVRERSQSAGEVSRDLRRFKVDSGRQRVSRVSTIRPAYQAGMTGSGPTTVAANPSAARKSTLTRIGSIFPWLLVALLGVALILSLVRQASVSSGPAGKVRFSTSAPPGNSLTTFEPNNVVISPDGSRLALVMLDSLGIHNLWVRPLNSMSAIKLQGTQGAQFPFWSPDSRFIGFFAEGKLKKIDIAGGIPTTVCDAVDGRGGSWNREGIIAFPPNQIGGLCQVAAGGGIPRPITVLDSLRDETTHRWPWFLPDGDHYLYYARSGMVGDADKDAVYIGSLKDSTSKTFLMKHMGNVIYARGHLLFARGGALTVQRFDSDRLLLTGDPYPVEDGVTRNANYNSDVMSASETGVLAWLRGEVRYNAQLVWFDRRGQVLDTIGDPAVQWNCELSPDDKRLAIEVYDEKANSSIWIVDLSRELRTRLTFDQDQAASPVWSPDGARICYADWQVIGTSVYVTDIAGSGVPQKIFDVMVPFRPMAWSSDGRYVLSRQVRDLGSGAMGPNDVVALPITDSPVAADVVPVSASNFAEDAGDFSPDGRWVVYASNESGSFEIYATRFMGAGGKAQVSGRGGTHPRWGRDGREILYRNTAGILTSVKVTIRGESLELGGEEALGVPIPSLSESPYDVSADGQRIIVVTPVGVTEAAEVHVLTNWDAEVVKK